MSAGVTYIDIEVQVEPHRAKRGLSRRKQQRKRRAILFIVAVAAMSGLLVFLFISRARAEVELSPRTCLGGWTNPSNAAGPPDVTDGDPTKYTSANSASTEGVIADLYCGDLSGQIPNGTVPTAIALHISWALLPPTAAPEIPITSGDLASSTSAVLNAPINSVGVASSTSGAATSSSDMPTPPTSKTQTDTTPVAPAQTPTETSTSSPQQTSPLLEATSTTQQLPPPQPTGATSTTSQQATTTTASLHRSLIGNVVAFFLPRVARAQEATTSGDLPATTTTATPVTDASASATSTATSTPQPAYEDAILEISYTLDGSSWHVIGTVTRFNFSDNTFQIPIDGVANWNDLEHMQIRIRSLSNLTNDPGAIYVDGMTIIAQYENVATTQQNEKTPRSLQTNDVINDGEASIFIVHPDHVASSTNIIFYQLSPNGMWNYVAEAVEHGDAPLSEYFAPPPPPGKYRMIQYVNDGGSFECNSKSATECMHGSHFVKQVDFEVTTGTTGSSTTTPSLPQTPSASSTAPAP